jgi:hypothetical protein
VTFWERVVFNIVGAASSQAWRAWGAPRLITRIEAGD